VCSQERAISDTIAALGDGADHERKARPQQLSLPFSPLGLAASRTSGPLTEDSERVTRDSEKAAPESLRPRMRNEKRGCNCVCSFGMAFKPLQVVLVRTHGS
jgi:hypothetical protein